MDQGNIDGFLARNGLATRLANLSFDAVAIIRLEDGSFAWVNDRFCANTGLSREEVIGRSETEFSFFTSDEERVELALALRESGSYGPKVGRFRTGTSDVYAEVLAELVEIDGESYVVSVSRGMTEEVEALHMLQRRDAILQAAAFTAQRFLEPGAFDEQMTEVLERTGAAAQADRVFVYENAGGDDDVLTMSIAYEWVKEGLAPSADDPDNVGYPYDPEFTRWRDVLGSGEAIHAAIRDLPEIERSVLSTTGTGSMTIAPIFLGEEWWGFVGVFHQEGDRAPSAAEAEAMKVVAGSMGAVLARREAETRATEAETNFRRLVEQLPGAVYLEGLSGESKVTSYLSPGYKRMFDIEFEGAIPSRDLWSRIVHPDDLERVISESDVSDESGEVFELEYRLVVPGGRIVWVRDRAVIVRNDSGEPLFWLGLVIDITERVRVEQELRATGAKLQALIEQIPFATYVQSPKDPDRFYISPQVEQVTGYPMRNFSTIGFWDDIIHPDDFDEVLAESDRTDDTGEVFDMEYRIIDADGKARWIHETSVPVDRAEDGTHVWQGVFEDVTLRKASEQQLREAEERYRNLVELAPAITYQERVRPGGYPESAILYMSPQALLLLGYEALEVKDDPALFWDRVIHPGDKMGVVEESVASTVRGDAYRQEYRVVRKDGSIAWVHDQATMVRKEEDGTQYWHGFITDITDRKRAEQELERALAMERDAVERLQALDDLKNTFLNAVSHDLRTPLAAIHGLALTLERDDIGLEPRETRDLAGRIAANSRKLERLVIDLLDLDRLSRGIVDAKLSAMDLSLLVRKVVQEVDFMDEHPVSVEADPVVLPLDAPKVERIIENLLANTVRHTPPGTPVWVRVLPEDAGVVLAVEDGGPGVSSELKEAIFEPFRQGESPSRHSPGVGVGLSLVAAFAELHGGRAWVEDREGGGASFRVLFPFPRS